MTAPNARAAGPTRRGFLGRLWLWLGGLALIEGAWVASAVLRPRRTTGAGETGSIVMAGPVERFAPGSVTAFPAGRFYLSCTEDGGFLALSRRCTHLGCTVPWVEAEGRFVCPCHASAFDLHGNVLSPPAPRALDLHPVRIENGIVKVDTGTTVSRRVFEASQVARP